MKKFSILGVVLIAASAVTAAVLPSRASADKLQIFTPDGTLTASETPADGLGAETCAPRNSTALFNCHITVDLGTTADGDTSAATAD